MILLPCLNSALCGLSQTAHARIGPVRCFVEPCLKSFEGLALKASLLNLRSCAPCHLDRFLVWCAAHKLFKSFVRLLIKLAHYFLKPSVCSRQDCFAWHWDVWDVWQFLRLPWTCLWEPRGGQRRSWYSRVYILFNLESQWLLRGWLRVPLHILVKIESDLWPQHLSAVLILCVFQRAFWHHVDFSIISHLFNLSYSWLRLSKPLFLLC